MIRPLRKRRDSRSAGRFLQILVFLFLYAPIFLMVVFSFNASKSRTIWAGFTLDWYKMLFSDKLILNSLYITLVLALLSSLFATIIGTAAAIGIHNMKKAPKKTMLTLNNIPVVNPDILTGVSFMLLFVVVIRALEVVGINVQMGLPTLMIAHVTFNIPYVILSVMPKLRQLSKNMYEAALDLGATPFYAFRRIIFPEILPGVISGAVIAFTMSIDDFVISYFTAGTQVQTLPVTIYAMTRKRISPEINALSTLMFVTVLLLLVIINILQARDLRKHKIKTNQRG